MESGGIKLLLRSKWGLGSSVVAPRQKSGLKDPVPQKAVFLYQVKACSPDSTNTHASSWGKGTRRYVSALAGRCHRMHLHVCQSACMSVRGVHTKMSCLPHACTGCPSNEIWLRCTCAQAHAGALLCPCAGPSSPPTNPSAIGKFPPRPALPSKAPTAGNHLRMPRAVTSYLQARSCAALSRGRTGLFQVTGCI